MKMKESQLGQRLCGYQINRGQTMHSARDRMLCDIQQASGDAVVNAAYNAE